MGNQQAAARGATSMQPERPRVRTRIGSPPSSASPSTLHIEQSRWAANLLQRIATAAVLIPVVIVLAWFGGWLAFTAAALVLVLAARELHVMLARNHWQPLTALSVVAGLDLIASALLPSQRTLLIVIGSSVLVFGSFAWLMFTRPMVERTVVEWALTLAATLYLAVPLAFMLYLRGDRIGWTAPGFWWLLVLLLSVWANDTAALFAGYLLGRSGRHKLAPRISPNKTWEGFFGGLVFAIVTVVVVVPVANVALAPERNLTLPWHQQILLGVLISVAATIGDLSKSVLKRCTGVKDSGTILPGHGGILDRIDSTLSAVFVVVVYALISGHPR